MSQHNSANPALQVSYTLIRWWRAGGGTAVRLAGFWYSSLTMLRYSTFAIAEKKLMNVDTMASPYENEG